MSDYLRGVDRFQQPFGVERTVSLHTKTLAVTGRLDRLDDRHGELVVVDYKTGRAALSDDDARNSLPLALYAAAVGAMFGCRCLWVELHHLSTGKVLAHEQTPATLVRKVEEAESIALDLCRAEADYADLGGRFDALRAAGLTDLQVVRPTGPLPGRSAGRAGEVRLGRTGDRRLGGCESFGLKRARRGGR